MIRRYTFKLYPNATQLAAMENMLTLAARLYNALVEQRRDAWDRRRLSLTKFDQGREMTKLRREFPEYAAFGSGSCECMAARVDQAFKKYFDNVKAWRMGQWQKPFPPRPPRYKKRDEFPGWGLRENGRGWRFLGKKAYLGKSIGNVKLRGKFPAAPEAIRTAEVVKRGGKWFLSVVVQLPDVARPETKKGDALIELDLVESFGRMCRLTPGFFGDEASNQPANQGDISASGAENLHLGADHRLTASTGRGTRGAENLHLGADHRLSRARKAISVGAENLHLGADHRNGSKGRGQPKGAENLHRGTLHKPSRGKKNKKRREDNRRSRRNHQLHQLSTRITREFGNLLIRTPDIRAVTATAKGDKKEWGAMVDFKAKQNRRVLDMAAGKFIELLTYKAEALGHKVVVEKIADHETAIPNEIVRTAKLSRKLKRKSKHTGETNVRIVKSAA